MEFCVLVSATVCILTVCVLERLLYYSIHQGLLVLFGAGDMLLLLFVASMLLVATTHATPVVVHHLVWHLLLLLSGVTRAALAWSVVVGSTNQLAVLPVVSCTHSCSSIIHTLLCLTPKP